MADLEVKCAITSIQEELKLDDFLEHKKLSNSTNRHNYWPRRQDSTWHQFTPNGWLVSSLSPRTILPSQACFWNMKSWENYNFLCSLDFFFSFTESYFKYPPNLCGSANRPHLIGQIASLRDAALFRKLNIDVIVTLLCYCGYRMANQSVETEKSSHSIICQAHIAKYPPNRVLFSSFAALEFDWRYCIARTQGLPNSLSVP